MTMIGKERDNYPLIALSSSYLSRSLEFLIYYSLLADSTVVFPHTKNGNSISFETTTKKTLNMSYAPMHKIMRIIY